MRFYGKKILALSVSIFVLTACSFTKEDQLRGADSPYESQEPVELKTLVDGRPISEFLASEEDLRSMLIGFLGEADGNNDGDDSELYGDLQDIISLSRERLGGPASAVPAAYSGMGGVYSGLLLDFAECAFREGSYNPAFGEFFEIKGKIKKWYFYEESKSGYLEIDITVSTCNDGDVGFDNYYWLIGVVPGSFKIFEHSGSLGDPFPDAPMMLNAADIEARNLDRKLYAEGPGVFTLAVVKNGKTIPRSHPIYTPQKEDCIDIMFDTNMSGKIPKTIKEFPEQIGYCLGRCKRPPIINTH